ncbi:MAG: nucleotidyltransferase domain-containing protein [Pseudonocardia sp.]
MDFVHPVEALVPGVRGKILAACLRSDEPLTMRALARLAGVSPNQAALVIDQLDDLGLVQRQAAGRALLVSLVDENPAVAALRRVADLRSETLRLWRERAGQLDPEPMSLAVYGSWARGEARSGSDIDIMIVLPAGLDNTTEDRYREQVADWCVYAGRVAGLPVSPLVIDADESRAVSGELWDNIRRDAVVIAGDNPRTVLGAA